MYKILEVVTIEFETKKPYLVFNTPDAKYELLDPEDTFDKKTCTPTELLLISNETIKPGDYYYTSKPRALLKCLNDEDATDIKKNPFAQKVFVLTNDLPIGFINTYCDNPSIKQVLVKVDLINSPSGIITKVVKPLNIELPFSQLNRDIYEELDNNINRFKHSVIGLAIIDNNVYLVTSNDGTIVHGINIDNLGNTCLETLMTSDVEIVKLFPNNMSMFTFQKEYVQFANWYDKEIKKHLK